VLSNFNTRESGILQEFLVHGAAIREERARAAAAGEEPDFVPLVRSWGGVSIAYRKRMVDSPAYRLNHEEVIKALEEGITFIENINPEEAIVDECNAVISVRFRGEGKRLVELPAKSVLVAAGTTPNITYEKEYPGTFKMDSKKKFFAPHRMTRTAEGGIALQAVDENAPGGFFTSYSKNGRFVSYYGDNHPRYAGNVVKAMASARDGYPKVAALFAADLAALDSDGQPQRDAAWSELVARMDDELVARVQDVVRLTPTIVEV